MLQRLVPSNLSEILLHSALKHASQDLSLIFSHVGYPNSVINHG